MTTYKDAGVDLERAERLVEYIRSKVKKAFSGRLVTEFGGFATGMELKGYREPVVIASTDGVGTKLKLAQEMGVHKGVGKDLVAMNVNDVLATGAKPLLFLDYIATGKIEEKVLKEFIDGVVEACEEAGVVLAGGETAEMPGFYPEGVYDVSGFCVGVCEKGELITGKEVSPGDVLLGIKSSGFHSNGYSLIRKVLKEKGVSLEDPFPGHSLTVGEVLLTPTRIYTKEVLSLKEKVKLKAIAHITGGGIPGNLVRVLPEGVRAVVEKSSIPENPIFDWIRELGKVPEEEMFRTFNMGVGMVLVVSEEDKEKALELLGKEGFVCGYIEKGPKEVRIV